MMMNRIILLFIVFITSFSSLAAKLDDLILGASSLTNFVGKIQRDESGSTRKFELNPLFSLSLKQNFYEQFSIIPEVACGLPQKGEDSNIKSFHYEFLVNLGYNYSDFLFTAGMGLAFTRLTSDGGEVTLNNGLSTSIFYLPDFTSTSRNFIQTLGIDFLIYKQLAIQTKAQIYNATDNEKRAFSYLVGVNYHFGPLEWEY